MQYASLRTVRRRRLKCRPDFVNLQDSLDRVASWSKENCLCEKVFLQCTRRRDYMAPSIKCPDLYLLTYSVMSTQVVLIMPTVLTTSLLKS